MFRIAVISSLFLLFTPTPAAADKQIKTYDVIIVGGGIAGLTAAYYLDDGDRYDLLLLEKEDVIGGRASSGRYQNVIYPQGAEYLGKPEEPLSEMIDELRLVLREIPAPADILYRGGKFHYGELGKARLLVKESSLAEFNRFVGELNRVYDLYDDIPELSLRGELKRLDIISAGKWFAENKFPPIYRELYNVSARGLFGAGIDDISALSAIPEFAFDFEDYEGVRKEKDLREEFSEKNGPTGMYTFDDGIAALTLALAKDMAELIQTGIEVKTITKAGELYSINCVDAGGRERIYRSEAVVIATPAPIALNIAGDELDPGTRELLADITYAPYATVALFSSEPIFKEGFDLAVEDGQVFTDIYNGVWLAHHFGKGDAKRNNTWVTIAYVAPQSLQDAGSVMLPDAELVQVIKKTLDKILPGVSQKITGHNIRRFTFGFPVLTPGSYERMIALSGAENNGIFLAGDYLIYPTFEAAAVSGQLAAERVIEWLSD